MEGNPQNWGALGSLLLGWGGAVPTCIMPDLVKRYERY